MNPAEAGILLAAGLGAGFINTLAGGGSVLALPVLEAVTGSASIANGTNRIAIVLQNVAGVAGFGDRLDRPRALRLAVPMLIGGVAGAWVATMLSPTSMRFALSIAVALVAVSAVVRPPKTARLKGRGVDVALIVAGFYAGFVQAGVGFLLLAVLAGGLGLDLVRANAIKVFIVLLATIPALAIFALRGQVAWLPGLILAGGNMSGAWIASRMAVKKGAAWIRWIVVAAAILAIGKLLLFPAS
ncbi:MAG: sulfite exporter TauE/SafE family protein [Planctomycetota bacterium]